jgi:hypothetical protein
MLKQRNLVIRPDNQELAELEMKKLEHFGWVRVVDTPCADGSVMVSYVRDDEENAEAAENEYKYRSAKLATEFAQSANERLTTLSGSDRAKKKSVFPAILFGFFAAAFLALGVMLVVWDGFMRMLIPEKIAINGGWSFFNDYAIGSADPAGKARSIIFLCIACAAFFFFFIALMLSSIRKIKESNLDNLDYAQFALAEMTYYEEVSEAAQTEAQRLFPEQ